MKKEILVLLSIFTIMFFIPSVYAATATMEGNNWTNIDNILDSLGFAFLKNNSVSFADLQQNDTSDRNYLNLTFPTFQIANTTYLFKLNATTCAGTDKSQWNGTNFICSPDQNSGGTGEVGTSTTNQMNLSSASNASFANYSITLLQSLFNLQNLTNNYFNNTKLNKTGDTMSGILIISGWLNDSSGNAYLKNTTVLCGANMTCTQNINGSITLSSTGGSGSESGGIGSSTTNQMNLSSSSNASYANYSISFLNLLFDFTNMTKLNKTDAIPISNVTYLQQKLDFINNTFVNTSNNTYVQTNNGSYVLTNNLTYYNKADATYVNNTFNSNNRRDGGFVFTMDNTLGEQGNVSIPYSGNIVRVKVNGDVNGNATINLLNISTDITGGNNIVVSNAHNMTDTTLAGWTTAVNPDTVLRFNLSSVTNFTRISVGITIRKI